MATLTPLITAAMLRTVLSPTTYLAIYDDDDTGDPDVVDTSDPVVQTLGRAHVRCVSYLGPLYDKIPDGTDSSIPDLLIDAELNYAVGISLDRHPEYVRTFGLEPRRKGAYSAAEETMKAIQAGIMSLVDNPPEPKPANVGGVVVDGGQRVFLDSPNGCRNAGDF